MLKNMSAEMKKVGRNLARVKNQESGKDISYDLSAGKSVGKSFGSEPSRGEMKKGPITRGGGAAVRGTKSSSKLG
jgi:hypothetical protein